MNYISPEKCTNMLRAEFSITLHYFSKTCTFWHLEDFEISPKSKIYIQIDNEYDPEFQNQTSTEKKAFLNSETAIHLKPLKPTLTTMKTSLKVSPMTSYRFQILYTVEKRDFLNIKFLIRWFTDIIFYPMHICVFLVLGVRLCF